MSLAASIMWLIVFGVVFIVSTVVVVRQVIAKRQESKKEAK